MSRIVADGFRGSINLKGAPDDFSFKEALTDDEDEECRCCKRGGCCPEPGWCACCCCCKIRLAHIPDVICLVLLLFVTCLQLPNNIMGFLVVAVSRNVLAGFFFTLILLVYFPLLIGSTITFWKFRNTETPYNNCCCKVWFATSKHVVGQPSGCCWGRFRVIFNVLVFAAFLLLLTFSYLVLIPEASTLGDKIEERFGEYELPERATPTALSFGPWAFASLAGWGEYGSRDAPERFPVQTFKYKTGITRHADYQCDGSSRPWKPYLELDLHLPSSRANGGRVPIIFHVHGGAWHVQDKGEAAW